MATGCIGTWWDAGQRLHGGGAVADPEEGGGSGQDRPAGWLVAGAAASGGRADGGVGAGRGAGGDARSDPGARGHEASELQARQRLGAFLLRHGQAYGGKSRWTQAHWRWLEAVKLPSGAAAGAAGIPRGGEGMSQRVAGLEEQLRQALANWSLLAGGGGVDGAARGEPDCGDDDPGGAWRSEPVRLAAATDGVSGVDPERALQWRQPRQGGITKTGNGHVRRVLVEAAWNYRFPARKTRIIEQRRASARRRRCRTSPGRRRSACARATGRWKAGQAEAAGLHRGGAGTGGLHLGDRTSVAAASGLGQG